MNRSQYESLYSKVDNLQNKIENIKVDGLETRRSIASIQTDRQDFKIPRHSFKKPTKSSALKNNNLTKTPNLKPVRSKSPSKNSEKGIYLDRHCSRNKNSSRNSRSVSKSSELSNLPLRKLEKQPKYKISKEIQKQKSTEKNCSKTILKYTCHDKNSSYSEFIDNYQKTDEEPNTYESKKRGSLDVSESTKSHNKLVTIDVKEDGDPFELAQQMVLDRGLKFSQLPKLESCIREFQRKMFPHLY